MYKKADILENLGNWEAALDVYRKILEKNNPNLRLITQKSRKKVNEIEKTALNSR